jgi:hypothetical protein
MEVGLRGRRKVKALGSNEELDVAEPKGCRVGGGACVFAGSEQEEEGHGCHVGNSKVGWKCAGLGSIHHVSDDTDGDGLDPVVLFDVGCELALESKIDFPWEVKRGSAAPMPTNIWPTLRRASSTVRDRTALLLGAILPVR